MPTSRGPRYARRQLEGLLADPPYRDPGFGYYIFVRQVCQVCGRFASFAGFFSVFAVFRDGECVDGRDTQGLWHNHPRLEAELRLARPTRWCELCRLRVTKATLTKASHWWYCERCGELMRELAPVHAPRDVALALVHWRAQSARYPHLSRWQ